MKLCFWTQPQTGGERIRTESQKWHTIEQLEVRRKGLENGMILGTANGPGGINYVLCFSGG